MKTASGKTEYYLCHLSDGSGCWVKAWRGRTNHSPTYEPGGIVYWHAPGELLPPDPAWGSQEIRIPRKLARCLIRSWRRRNPVESVTRADILKWAAWVDHTEGTEVACRDRDVRIAHAILEADEGEGRNRRLERELLEADDKAKAWRRK